MTRARTLEAVVGASLLLAVVVGRTALFVRPWFVPVVALTGVLLLVAAARTDADERTPRTTAVLLLLPVVAGAALTPTLAGEAPVWGAADGATISARLGDTDNPLLAGGDGPVTVLDIALAERELGAAALDGRQVTVEAVVGRDGGLFRQVMVCCAADARPVTVSTAGDLPPPGSWVRASGTLEAHGATVVMRVDDVTTIETPRDPLL